MEGNKINGLRSTACNSVRAAIMKQVYSAEDVTVTTERIRRGMLLPLIPESSKTVADVTAHTIEDVKKKLEAELEVYRDGDSRYIVEKLVELCQKDKVLLEAIMLPQKSYDKAFQYFYQRSRIVGYKMPYGNLVYLNNDTAVKLSVEYFKTDKAEKTMQKALSKQTHNKAKAQPLKGNAEDTPTVNESKRDMSKKELEVSEHKTKAKGIDGQLSLFDL